MQLISTIAAFIIAWIVFTILVKILKITVSNALAIAAIIVLLQIGFGISPQDVWHQLMQLPQILKQISEGK